MDDQELRESFRRVEACVADLSDLVGDVSSNIKENRLVGSVMVGEVKTQLALLAASVTALGSQLPPIIQASGAASNAMLEAVDEMKRNHSRDDWDAALKASAASNESGVKVWQKVVFVLLALLAGSLGVKELLPSLVKLFIP